MAVRKIIEIDEDKCNGCGLCMPNCAEGAIQIIDGKAKLISDIYCDGLGACLGHCPQDALKLIEREADAFDEEAVEALLATQNKGTTNSMIPSSAVPKPSINGGCPGSKMMQFKGRVEDSLVTETVNSGDVEIKIKSQLTQWPVQLKLVPVNAPYFDNADLLVTADCVPFAYPNYHLDLLKGKAVVVGCPKLDDIELYIDKLTQIIKNNHIQSVTVAFMEVPCCQGIVRAVEIAVARANKTIEVNKIQIGIQGSKTII